MPVLEAPAAAHAAVTDPVTPLPLRVVIADDHPLFRRGLARALQRDERFELIGEAADGGDALALIDALEPDVAVVDVRMPRLSGIEVCARVSERGWDVPPALLVLSAFDDEDLVAQAVAAGAAGYVGKDEPQIAVCEAIETVGRGGIHFTDRTAAGFRLRFAERYGLATRPGRRA